MLSDSDGTSELKSQLSQLVTVVIIADIKIGGPFISVALHSHLCTNVPLNPHSLRGGSREFCWGVNYGKRGSASLYGGLGACPSGVQGKAPGQGVRGTKSP